MPQLLPPIDHISEGLGRVIYQYRSKPKLMTYIACLLDQVQCLDDAAEQVFEAFCFDNAVAQRLRVLGDLVGQEPSGLGDDAFRTLIRARIRANRSEGKIGDLCSIADLLLSGYTYQATPGVVEFFTPVPATIAAVVWSVLQRACNQGGRIFLNWAADPAEQSFLFASAAECGAGISISADGGWDSAAGLTTAGKFRGLLA